KIIRQNFSFVTVAFLFNILNCFAGHCGPHPFPKILGGGFAPPPFSFHPGTVSYRHIVILTPIRYMI
ncbi:hypothetical protein K6720_02560, partial [Escherichia coli]|uniref:hypothetical protein n=1 Tax=Escherichia coli TaxID=562 RepID=UPI001C9AFB05